MRVLIRIREDAGLVMQIGSDVTGCLDGGGAQNTDTAVQISSSDSFAVPAGAFAIYPTICFPCVLNARPFETVCEFHFLHFIVVVHEDLSTAVPPSNLGAVTEVSRRRELMRMPGQIDI